MAQMRKIFVAVTAAALLTAAVAVIFSVITVKKTTLVISDADTNELYAQYEVQVGEEFSVSFIHSVNLTEVYDYYIVGERELVCDKCVYSSFGAGMPTEWDESWTVSYDNGKITISGLDIHKKEITYFVGTVYDHVLNINGQDISLSELCGKNAHITLKIKESVCFR